jgi:UDP-N-acetyl-D-glucosamine/UDP-N-acetyl-D-galactosamine dehydrogenase
MTIESATLPSNQQIQIAVIGLGYVGLPLAVEFGQHFPTLGFDINSKRIAELQRHQDHTLEVSAQAFASATHLQFTANAADLRQANVYIVTVPTPIDRHKRPDLLPLESASRLIGSLLSAGNVVIYESTVYPGATEEICVPLLTQGSGLTFNQDYFVGYSPERINPGDKQHRLPDIKKITSGSTAEAAHWVNALYQTIIRAGTHQASSIRVAEAAKVIENTQRDVNIALINELALLFDRLEIDTQEVLEAAATKWNFLPFKPGLVGGHCISVDPYYLTHKAQEVGHHPDVILAGRRINDYMGTHIANKLVQLMLQHKIAVADANILIMGLTFKENCPDLRNSRVIDVINGLATYHTHLDVYDPWADADIAHEEYGVSLIETLTANRYDAVVVCVGHQRFVEMGIDNIRSLCKPNSVILDVKAIFPKQKVDARL